MLNLQIIGNLGADAQLHNENGNEFVTFKVAHTDRIVKTNGETEERTQWVSCVLNGRNEKLLPHLLKGQKVFCLGDCTVRTYHSEKQRALVAGINMFVRRVEFVGAKPDSVPRDLYDTDGVAHSVGKFYFSESAKAMGVTTLYDMANRPYTVVDGWISPSQTEQSNEVNQANATAEEPTEPTEETNVNEVF